MTKIILATTSKYKIKAFSYLKVPFKTEDSEVDEYQFKRDNPIKLVKKLSKLKAEAVAKKNKNAIVLGFDSVAYFKGKILEKAKNKEEVYKRLKLLSGKKHQTMTGITVINTKNKKIKQIVVKTTVKLRKLVDQEIKQYIKEDKDILHYCLGYDPELGRSASFVESIKGSYNNLLNGMPIEVIPKLLEAIK